VSIGGVFGRQRRDRYPDTFVIDDTLPNREEPVDGRLRLAWPTTVSGVAPAMSTTW
jgi:hypothetical protein